MSIEIVTVLAPWLGEWVTVKIAEAVLGGLNTQLQPKDFDKALKTCVVAADREVKLFWRCEPRFIPKFLEQVFQNVTEELQKPFKSQGTPQVEYLVVIFKKVLEEHPKIKQDIDESLIQSWLEVFTKKYFEATDLYLHYQIAKNDYVKQVAKYFDDVKFAGIAVEGKESDKSAKLMDIFVMPDIIENFNRASLHNSQSEASSRQAELMLEQWQLAQLSQDTDRKILAKELLDESQSKKIVLLGAPGSGKTTLVNYFMLTLAQKKDDPGDILPVVIRIRDLARRADNISILEFIEQFVVRNLQLRGLPPGFFEYWLLDGQALILLDGLDEVDDLGKRYEIVNQIESFLNKYPNNYTIITSRPAGYRLDFFHTEDYAHYTLLPFDNMKVEEFINKWYDSRFKDPVEAQRWKESLRKALAEQKRIKELARNPLLITIIALIHIYEAYLPRNRYKLYERAVKTLLTNWDAGKELNYKLPFEYLNRDDIQRLMEQLAYWIHAQGGTGDKEGGTLIDKDELIKQLGKYIAEQYNLQRHQAKAEAERFVEHIRERCGLLNEQGQDCYAFVHKTFQEYLAAQEIRDKQEGDGDEVALEHIEKYLHNPHWREVLLLLISQQHRKKTSKFLKYILEIDTPYEQWLHRNLFFAANCLAEDIDVVDEDLLTDILQQLIQIEIFYDGLVGLNVQRQAENSICNLQKTKFASRILKKLRESSNLIKKVRLQNYYIKLGEQQEAAESLLLMLKQGNQLERFRSAEALSILGNDSEEVVNEIIQQLQDEHTITRRFAAIALARLKKGELAAEILIPMLSDNNCAIRANAAEALGNLNYKPKVIEALLVTIEDEEYSVKIRAAEALGLLGQASEKIVNALILMLDDEDFHLRYRAAEVLMGSSDLFKPYQELIPALLSKLNDEEVIVRLRAITALGELGNSSDKVIQALMLKLKDKHTSVRGAAAMALVKLGKTPSEIINILVELIERHQYSEDVRGEIHALWKLVHD